MKGAVLITLGSALLFAGYCRLPSGTRLTHMDFLADKTTVLEYCDVGNPRPPLNVAARQPVTMRAKMDLAGRCTLTLTTASGEPVGPADILPEGHPDLRLSVIDASGASVRVESVAPGRSRGEWTFVAEPGSRRAVAEFTPAATHATLRVSSDVGSL